jgi:hypothetical protein
MKSTEKKWLLVEKCSDSTKWYADKIHMTFPIVAEYSREVLVRTFDSYNTCNFVANEDCSFIWKVEVVDA